MKTEHPDSGDNLDIRIDAALREDRTAPVPAGFHGRVCRRVRIAALLQRERREFRQRMLRATGFSTLLLTVTGWAIAYWIPSTAVFSSIPGGLGYFDYLTVATQRAWLSSSNPALLLSAGAVLVTLFIAGAFVTAFGRSDHS